MTVRVVTAACALLHQTAEMANAKQMIGVSDFFSSLFIVSTCSAEDRNKCIYGKASAWCGCNPTPLNSGRGTATERLCVCVCVGECVRRRCVDQ